MKRLLTIIFLFTALVGCSNRYYTQQKFKQVSTDGLTYDGTHIYYKGELCATMSAVELSYDNGEIVREITFIIQSSEFNEQALPIIKLIQSKSQSMEVEVELKHELKHTKRLDIPK